MSYLSINALKGGMDRRHKRISAEPGTLWTLTNGHLTRGGEIERAKKFVSKYTLPDGTFSMAGINGALYVFGSATDPGVPAGVTYQRLQHPDGSTAMTKVMDWQPFDGKIYAVAQFADGKVYHFYDGEIVQDWIAGEVRTDQATLANVAAALAALIEADDDYTATSVGNVITITGADTADFTVDLLAEDGGTVDDQTIVTAVSQQNVPATAEVLATGGFTVVYGKVSAGVNKINSVKVNGVTITGGAVDYATSEALTAAAIAASINSATTSPDYTATADGADVIISAIAGSGSSPNAFAVEANVAGEVILTNGGFSVTGGTSNPGTNRVTSVKVNGIEILNTAVDWATSNSATATAIAAQINSYSSSPDYVASANGQDVYICPIQVRDTTPKNLTIVITKGGDVSIENAININTTAFRMDGGVGVSVGQSKIVTVTLGGTFDPGDLFTIKLTKNGTTKVFGADGNPRPPGEVLLTFKSKMHAAKESAVNFSAVNNATVWNRDNTVDVGAGFINAASQTSGSQIVTALDTYQGLLAIFARNTIQLWQIDADPAVNTPVQLLKNTGTRARRSVLGFGETDVFYLADSGIRSLKARDASNAAYANDIGTAMDTYVLAYLKTLTDDQITAACSIMEPGDDRYWLAVGNRIFVFSFFPNSKISAWSSYEPGISITDMVRLDLELYVRAGNTIYLYGGDDGETYPAADETPVTVELPFYSAGMDATMKKWVGFDCAMTNTWLVTAITDPNREDVEHTVGSFNRITYRKGQNTVFDASTHFALKLTCDRAGAASIDKMAIHYFETYDAR